MKIKRTIGILIIILFASQMLLTVSSGNMQITNISHSYINATNPVEEIDFVTEAGPGFEEVKSNIVPNSDFEEIDAYNAPDYFWYYGSGYATTNASYQDDVYAGSYSMLYTVQGTSQFNFDYYNSRSLTNNPDYPYLLEDISLDMWFKTNSHLDNFSTFSYMTVQVYTGSTNYYLNYYFHLHGGLPGSNSTYHAYFDTRETLGSWHHLQRDITGDLTAAFPSVTITSSFYVSYITFRGSSPQGALGPLEMLVDEIALENSTAYDYFWDNGDFEYGDSYSWNEYFYGPGTAEVTSADSTSGSSCVNITADAYYDDSSSYMYLEQDLIENWGYRDDGYYPIAPGEVVIDFDWKYTDTQNGGYSQLAIFNLYIENETYGSYVFFYLGVYDDTISGTNITQPNYSYRYYTVPGFGNRGTWEHFHFDLYDIYNDLGLSDIVPTYYGWQANAGDEQNSTVTLLVDDFIITANPLGDPSFEQAEYWSSNDPLRSWYSHNHNFVNRTTDAHTGVYAANVTAHSSSSVYAYRSTFLPIEQNLYTDFWWRLDELSGITTTYSSIRLEFNDNRYLYYILASTPATFFSNSSNYVYFYDIEGYNQTGVWHNIHRNLEADILAAFGDPTGWNLTEVRMYSSASGVSVVSTIFDDMYFVRDIAPPEITNLQQSPLVPQYDEMVTIEVDVTDNVEIITVELIYRVDAGEWQTITMGGAGDRYSGLIPITLWDSLVQYYIFAIDIYGNEAYLDNGGAYYDYVTIDTINPLLDVEAPNESEPVVGPLIFNITGFDAGSGTASFVVEVDGVIFLTDTDVPVNFIWETNFRDNGNHMINFTLTDHAGNFVEISYEYLVDHHVPWHFRTYYFLEKWWPYLTAGSGALIVGIITLVIVVRVRKRRKAAA